MLNEYKHCITYYVKERAIGIIKDKVYIPYKG